MKLLPALVLLCCVPCVYTITCMFPPTTYTQCPIIPGGIIRITYTLGTSTNTGSALYMNSCPMPGDCQTTVSQGTVRSTSAVPPLYMVTSLTLHDNIYNVLQEYVSTETGTIIGPFDVNLSPNGEPVGQLAYYNRDGVTVTVQYIYNCVGGSTWSTTGIGLPCNTCTVCGTGQYASSACISTRDALCTACTVCGTGKYASSACISTSNALCTA